jgi:hypothetical protein
MVVIIPEELKNHRGHFTYGSLEQERQQHSVFPFKNLFAEEKEQGGQWKAGGCCAMQHNMYVCVDNCYY